MYVWVIAHFKNNAEGFEYDKMYSLCFLQMGRMVIRTLPIQPYTVAHL